jgi:hypothetical protein
VFGEITERLHYAKECFMQLSGRLLRNLHLATAPVIGAFVYSAALRENDIFVAIVQWGVFPVVAGAGLALWIRPRLVRRTQGKDQ